MDAVTYRYDDHGNLVEKTTPEQTLLFEYDLDNQLSRVADQHNATIATYGYDALRRRVWKEVHGSRTYYHYSDQGLVAELDATGTLLKSYGYKPGSPWGTGPLYVRQGGKNHWYLTDHLGTPQQIVAENGAAVWQAQYKVFGKGEIDAGSTITSNLRFPGQYYDAETGLHYNWNRYYDPEIGRYTQTDPIGFEGGINLYSYVENNPILKIDPLGLAGFDPGPSPGDPFSEGREPRTPWLPTNLDNRSKSCPPYYHAQFFSTHGLIPLVNEEEVSMPKCKTKIICYYSGKIGISMNWESHELTYRDFQRKITIVKNKENCCED